MSIQDANAEELAISARASLSSYCYNECRASCCRKGYILLTAEEAIVMQGDHKEKLKMIPVETATNKNAFVLDMDVKKKGCPNLVDYKCSIHKNPGRPNTCKEFPLFIWKDKTIMVTFECPAIKDNQLYPYLAEFKRRGYKLIYLPSKDRCDCGYSTA
jgi:Fe-S-cluster containining protein